MNNFKIKNNISNSKEVKKELLLKKYINIRRFFRLKTKKILPLSKQEEVLYFKPSKNERTIKPLQEKDFFESTGNIFLLFTYPKSDIHNLEKNLKKLILNNPSKNFLSSTIVDDRFSERFASYKFSNNYNAWSNIGFCSPIDKNLENIVDYIEIFIFNFSNDYIGISFNLILSDDFTEYLSTAYKKTTGLDTYRYHFYRYKKKRLIGLTSYSPEIIRMQDVENILIEVKMRAFNFLKKYISIKNVPTFAPISIDVYCSNISDPNNQFYRSYGCLFEQEDLKHNLSIIYEENSHQNFIETDFFVELYYKSNFNRSSRLILINDENISKKIIIQTNELLNIFIQKLCIELSYELNILITKERTLIEQNYDKSERKFNNLYNSLYKEIFTYEMIFNEITPIHDRFIDGFIDDTIKEYFNNFQKYYKKLLEKHHIIEKASNDKMLISNYKSTRNLAIISIIIAIVTLGISIFFEYRQEYPDYSNQLNKLDNHFYMIYNELNSIDTKIENLKSD